MDQFFHDYLLTIDLLDFVGRLSGTGSCQGGRVLKIVFAGIFTGGCDGHEVVVDELVVAVDAVQCLPNDTRLFQETLVGDQQKQLLKKNESK